MVDLHTHTDESDGTYTPAELVDAALAAGLRVLAITDHDTFEGYEKASALTHDGLRLVRGIELNTREANRSVHLLAYFGRREPSASFHTWLNRMTAARRDRNLRLAAKLRELGVEITIEEVEALGRSLAGRPHFARLLVQKGYAANRDEAFSRFLGETGSAFVERDSPSLEETIRLVIEAGGTPSLAHPIRLNGGRNPEGEERMIAGLRDAGLPAIEVYHSDHSVADIARYGEIARKYGFAATGGSDFHGLNKANTRLGFAVSGSVPIPGLVASAVVD